MMDEAVGWIRTFVSPPPNDVVTELESKDLLQAIIVDEVWRAVWSMIEDKALGQDGFPLFFFR